MRCSNCGYTADAEFRFCPECGAQQVTGSEDPLLGRILSDRYRVLEPLGEGSMGSVYLAEHTAIKRRIAIKVLHRDLQVDEETLHRFQREGIAAGQIEHPCALQIFDLGREDDGTLFLAMEYIEGNNLDEFLKDTGPLEPDIAVDLMAQLLDTLATAHAAGVVHRDLKPANLIVSTDDEGGHHLKVLDFGLSKLVDQKNDVSVMTRSGRMLGTPMYMAPEQWAGTTVDHRADLYAAGLLLYEMLAGKRPYAGGDLSQLFVKATQEPPPSLLEVADSQAVPADLEDWLQTALQKDADERFQDASEMLEELENARLDKLISPKRARTRPGAGERSGTDSDSPANASPRRSSSRKPAIRSSANRRHGSSRDRRAAAPARDNKPMWIGGGLAALAVLGIGGFLLFGGGGGDSTGDGNGGDGEPVVARAGGQGSQSPAAGATMVREIAAADRSVAQTAYLTLLDEGWVALRTGELATASDKANTALALAEADAEAYLLRALVFTAQDDDDTARGDLKDALDLQPSYAAARAELGWLEFRASDSSAAAAAFDKVLESAPDNAEALTGKAALRWAEDDADGALEFATRATDAEPRNSRAHRWKGRALQLGGDLPGAIESFVEAKRHAPRDAEPVLDLALAYRRSGDATSAERQYRAALDLNDRSLAANRGLGELLLESSRASEAYQLLSANRGLLKRGADLLVLGLAANATGQADTDEIFEQCLELGIERPARIHVLLAQRAMTAENWIRAASQAEAALAADNRNPTACVLLGVARFRQREYATAAEVLQRALEIERDNAFALRTLGLLYMDYLDRGGEALELLQRAKRAGDEHPQLDAWITRLGG